MIPIFQCSHLLSQQKGSEITETENMDPMFYAGEETIEALKLKLVHNKLKIDRANNLMMHLQNLMNDISEDSNRIEHQLRTQLLSMMSSSVDPESFLLFSSDESSCISEATCFSDISSPVDSNMDSVSSSAFSNPNSVVDGNNYVGFVNEQPWVQPGLPEFDPASVVIQSVLEGKVLPEEEKLLQSVVDAGPLLQMPHVARPLPMWRYPPPPQPINFVPPSPIQYPYIAHIGGNAAHLEGSSSSNSMLNFAGIPPAPWIHDNQVRASEQQRL